MANFQRKWASASATIFSHKSALDKVFHSSASDEDMERDMLDDDDVMDDVIDLPGFLPFFFLEALEEEDAAEAEAEELEEADAPGVGEVLPPVGDPLEASKADSPTVEASRKQLRKRATAAAV